MAGPRNRPGRAVRTEPETRPLVPTYYGSELELSIYEPPSVLGLGRRVISTFLLDTRGWTRDGPSSRLRTRVRWGGKMGEMRGDGMIFF